MSEDKTFYTELMEVINGDKVFEVRVKCSHDTSWPHIEPIRVRAKSLSKILSSCAKVLQKNDEIIEIRVNRFGYSQGFYVSDD